MPYDYKKDDTLIALAKAMLEWKECGALTKEENDRKKLLALDKQIKELKTKVEELRKKWNEEYSMGYFWCHLFFSLKDDVDSYDLQEAIHDSDATFEFSVEAVWDGNLEVEEVVNNPEQIEKAKTQIFEAFGDYLKQGENDVVVKPQMDYPFDESTYDAQRYLERFGLMKGQKIIKVQMEMFIKLDDGTPVPQEFKEGMGEGIIYKLNVDVAIPNDMAGDEDSEKYHTYRVLDKTRKQMIKEMIGFNIIFPNGEFSE